MRRDLRGLTMIEFLTVIAIIGIATTIALPSASALKKNVVLGGAAQEVVNGLRIAQNRALASQDGTTHGVFFETGQFTVYSGDCSTRNKPEVRPLSRGLEIQGAALNRDIVFSRLEGRPTAYDCATGNPIATPNVVVGFPSGDTKTVVVNSLGTLSIQ